MAWTDRYVTAGAAGGGDGSSGNPWTLAEAISNAAAGDRVNIQAGIYASTTTTRTFATVGTTTAPVWWRGYKTAIGDMDSASHGVFASGTEIPALTFTTGRMSVSQPHQIFSNLDIQSAATAGSALGASGVNTRYHRLRVQNTGTNALSRAVLAGSNNNQTFTRCWFKATTSASSVVQAATHVEFDSCVFDGGSVGLDITGNIPFVRRCIFDSPSSHAITCASSSLGEFLDCIFYNTGAGADGIRFTALGSNHWIIKDCIFSMIGGYAINNASGTNTNFVKRIGNAYHAITSSYEFGFGDSPALDEVPLSASPFSDPAGDNFNINNIAGGGAVLRAIAFSSPR